MRIAIEDLDVVKLNDLIDKGERFEVYSHSEEEGDELWCRDDSFWEEDV
jgi:hypothetical protein